MGYGYDEYRPYVSVAKRRAQAQREMARLKKEGHDIRPITVPGRKIATTFWGQAWCDQLESFSDFANRLPRGRTYVRNGSVCHLGITKGQVDAKVSGSEIYDVQIKIATLPRPKWTKLKEQCTGQIGSLLELLSGRLSDKVMKVVTHRSQGLFPQPGEITFDCDCPDWATMCKHVAAVLYGVGSRLDQEPQLLFELRGTDVEELIQADAETALEGSLKAGDGQHLLGEDLSDIFGIDLADPAGDVQKEPKQKSPRKSRKRSQPSKKAAKKAPSEKSASSPKQTTSKRKAKASAKKKASVAKKNLKASAKKKAPTTKAKASAKKKNGKSASTRKKSS